MTLSLILLANFHYTDLNPKTKDVVFLTAVLYFFVFFNTIIFLMKAYFMGEEKQKELEVEKQKLEKGYLVVRSERKSKQIPYDHIAYVESVGNYVRIQSSSGESILTKEKISRLNAILPDHFLRIHRSIVVNRDKIQLKMICP